MTARGDDLADLCASAARVRDAGLTSSGRLGPNGRLPVSYSRKVFIPVTHLCRDTCHYCTFVAVPGKLRAQGLGMYMEPDEILDVARRGAELGCKEALFTLGDRPETRWDEARQWLDERGYNSTLDYVRAMAIRVLEETGLLPHLNPGVMTWSELSRLKPVAPSMGMMLETTSRRLFETKGLAHYGSPDKDPEVRLRTLADAGRLSIPFTTGLLVGIGETLTERAETLHAIRRSHKEFGHVQEVIVQNFRAKDHTAMCWRARRRHRRLRGDGRRRPAGAGTQDAHPGTAQSGVARRVPGPDRRRRRRLGRGVTVDPRSRQPRTPVAGVGRAGRRHRRGGLRPGAAADRPAALRAGGRGMDRPARAGACRGAGRPRHRLRVGRQSGGAAMAGARRGRRVARPDRPAFRDRCRRAPDDHTQRLEQRVRGLGVHPGEGGGARRPGAGAHRHRHRRRVALSGAGSGRLHRRRVSGVGHRRRAGPGCGCRAGGFAASRYRRRRRHVRGEPEYQLHQHLLHRMPVLRVRPTQGRRRRLLAVDRRGRRPGVGGARRRSDRGVHAGRHRPRAAGHRIRRPGARGEGSGCRRCTCTRSPRWRSPTASPRAGCPSGSG